MKLHRWALWAGLAAAAVYLLRRRGGGSGAFFDFTPTAGQRSEDRFLDSQAAAIVEGAKTALERVRGEIASFGQAHDIAKGAQGLEGRKLDLEGRRLDLDAAKIAGAEKDAAANRALTDTIAGKIKDVPAGEFVSVLQAGLKNIQNLFYPPGGGVRPAI